MAEVDLEGAGVLGCGGEADSKDESRVDAGLDGRGDITLPEDTVDAGVEDERLFASLGPLRAASAAVSQETEPWVLAWEEETAGLFALAWSCVGCAFAGVSGAEEADLNAAGVPKGGRGRIGGEWDDEGG